MFEGMSVWSVMLIGAIVGIIKSFTRDDSPPADERKKDGDEEKK
jgi:hypothetical protein